MATFRTDPNTGRTVISEENRVDRSGLSGRRGSTVQSRTSGGPNQSDGPTGGFGPPVGFESSGDDLVFNHVPTVGENTYEVLKSHVRKHQGMSRSLQIVSGDYRICF